MRALAVFLLLVAAAGFTVQQTETIGAGTKSIFLVAHAPTKAD